MTLVGRILAVVLILVIVPLFTFSACNPAVERTMRNPDIYRDAFINQNIFEEVMAVALPAIVQSAKTADIHLEGAPVQLSEVIQTVSQEDREAATKELVPPEWLQAQFEVIVDSLLSLFKGDFSALDNPIDLNALKIRLTGEPAQQAAERIILAAPECTAGLRHHH